MTARQAKEIQKVLDKELKLPKDKQNQSFIKYCRNLLKNK